MDCLAPRRFLISRVLEVSPIPSLIKVPLSHPLSQTAVHSQRVTYRTWRLCSSHCLRFSMPYFPKHPRHSPAICHSLRLPVQTAVSVSSGQECPSLPLNNCIICNTINNNSQHHRCLRHRQCNPPFPMSKFNLHPIWVSLQKSKTLIPQVFHPPSALLNPLLSHKWP